jgi:hypothetical protein
LQLGGDIWRYYNGYIVLVVHGTSGHVVMLELRVEMWSCNSGLRITLWQEVKNGRLQLNESKER